MAIFPAGFESALFYLLDAGLMDVYFASRGRSVVVNLLSDNNV